MQNSPIDLLARAPGQHRTAPPESEPDSRFSELLRRPAEAAERTPSDSAPPGTAEQAAQTDAGAAPRTGTDSPVSTDADGTAASPLAGAAPVDAIQTLPEAITQATAAVDGPVLVSVPDSDGRPESATPNWPIAPGSAPVALPEAAGDAPPTQNTAATPTGAAPKPTPAEPADHATAPTDQAAQPPQAQAAAPAPQDPVQPAVTPIAATDDGAENTPLAPAVATRARPTEPAGPPAATNPGRAAPNPAVPVAAEQAVAARSPRAVSAPPAPVAGDPAAEIPADGSDGLLDVTDLPAPRAGAKPDMVAGTAVPASPNSKPAARQPSGDALVAPMRPTVQPDVRMTDAPQPTIQADPAATPAPGTTARPAFDAAAALQTTTGTTPPPPATEQVLVQVRKAVAAGVDRLTVQLKPATLGRVDVQMEVGHDGRVQAVVSAERPETLYLLQRDARALTTALTDAGLQADSGSLSFNLRGQSGDQPGTGAQQPADGGAPTRDGAVEDGGDPVKPITLTLGAGRVDIKV